MLDRHIADRGDKVAILWEGDEPDQIQRLTYTELLAEVCKLANVLKANGVEKGDRVIIYMGMIPQAGIAMLACARLEQYIRWSLVGSVPMRFETGLKTVLRR